MTVTRRHYSNTAVQTTLSAPIVSASTSCTATGTFAGWPSSFPFYAALDPGSLAAEIVLVTAITGSTATITRGQDGTTAVSHGTGSPFVPMVVAKDLDEANAHNVATSGVHGITGNVVGDSDTQLLSNKTVTPITVTDWNSATAAGMYHGEGSAANAPAAHAFTGFVLTGTGGTITQVAWRTTGSATSFEQWQRIYTGSAWGSWLQTVPTLTPQTVTDWNAATTAGIYYAASGAANEPSFDNHAGFVFTGPSGEITQAIWRITATGQPLDIAQWSRIYTGSSWTAWFQTAGRPSTPSFTALTLQSGLSIQGGMTPGYYMPNSYELKMHGLIHYNAGNFPAATGTLLLVLPAGATPAAGPREYETSSDGTPSGVRIEIAANGNLTVITSPGQTPSWVALDGINFFTV